MGFRFRKSINLGKGFRINLSKSGIGYSWGVKGFRTTRTSTGKKMNTYSIPGTGISYVDVKGTTKKTSKTINNNPETEENYINKGGTTMKKISKGFLGFLLFLIIIAYFPALILIGGVAAIAYFIKNKQIFMEKSLIKRIGISTLLFFVMLFGIAGTFGKSNDSSQDIASNIESEVNDDSSAQALVSESESLPEEPTNEDMPVEQPADIEQSTTQEQTEEVINEIEQPKNEEQTSIDQTPAVIVTPVISNTSEETPDITQSEADTTPPEVQEPTVEEIAVYLTNTGSKYHRAGCRHLSDSKLETTLTNALNQGYTACKTCRP